MYRLSWNRNSVSQPWLQTNAGGVLVLVLFQHDILLIILTFALPRHQRQDDYASSLIRVHIFRTDRDSLTETQIPDILAPVWTNIKTCRFDQCSSVQAGDRWDCQ